MKKLIFSITLAVTAMILGTTNTYAQQTKVGIKAGLSLTTLGAATFSGLSVNYDHRPGFQGGLFLETPLSKTVLFSPQVLFTQKGGNINTTINSVNVKGSTQINYIDVPLLVGFKANANLAFYVGPQVSFLLSQKDVYTVGSTTTTNTSTTGTKKTLFGGNIGAGYKFTDKVSLNANYIFDFGEAAEAASSSGEKNSGFVFTLGLLF